MPLKDQLEKLAKEYALVPHTEAGRTFSTVRHGLTVAIGAKRTCKNLGLDHLCRE
jgi:hypothetical protein